MNELIDIGANLTHDSFDHDRDQVIERAITRAVDGMNFITQPIASGRLRDKNPLVRRFEITLSGNAKPLVIAEASSKGYSAISEAQILPRKCWVNPVLANGRILAKNNKGKTVCIDVR